MNSATTTATIGCPPPPPPGGTLTDGAPLLTYDPISNRISATGYQYDFAGNLTRGQAESGVWQRYQYDAANRLVAVMNDSSVVIVTNSYDAGNGRLKSVENGVARWYGWEGGQAIIEYSDNGTNLVWAKSYVYLGGRVLLTDEPVIGRQYHHADRLGTRIVTNPSGAKLSEQATLPFGTALGSPETTGTPTNRRFTSYERSSATKLDYAVNRSYASWQGRFTQVDPLGMGAVSVGNPQSLNLYGYVENDPVNFVDPTGLNAQNCIEVRIWGHPEQNGEQSGPSREIIYRFCTTDHNAGIGDFGGYTNFSGGGAGPQNPIKEVKQDLAKLKECLEHAEQVYSQKADQLRQATESFFTLGISAWKPSSGDLWQTGIDALITLGLVIWKKGAKKAAVVAAGSSVAVASVAYATYKGVSGYSGLIKWQNGIVKEREIDVRKCFDKYDPGEYRSNWWQYLRTQGYSRN